MAKKPKHIEEYHDLAERVEGALKTTDHHHRRAFIEGEKTIMDEDGNIDYNKLKEEANQEKFSKAMVDTYIDAARQYFHIGKDKTGDDIWHEQLLNAYAGVTGAELKRNIRKAKERFDFEYFTENVRSDVMEKLRRQLESVKATSIKEEHLDDIVDYVGLKNVVDADRIKPSQAYVLLENHRKQGALTPKLVKEALPDYAIIDDDYRDAA